MKRVLLVVGLVAVLGIGVAVWLVYSRLDSLVAEAIETQGTEIVGAPVRVGSVRIDLREGRGTIRDLRVANPQGFSRQEAFRLDEITLTLDIASLTAKPLVVDELRVESPEARYEVDGAGRSNFTVIKSNVDRYSAQQPAAAGEPLRILIRQFQFEGGKVSADVSAVEKDQPRLEADLPAVRLRNVGGAQGGTPDEIGRTIVSAFTGQVVKTVAAHEASAQVERSIGGDAGKAAGGLLKKILD